MRFEVIARTRYSAISKRALLGAVAWPLLVAQAGAQFVNPGGVAGCSIAPFFTDQNNTTPASATAAGTSLAAAEASTVQAMEVVAQRRAQEAESCPEGFTKSGGVCRPIQRIASEVPASSVPSTPIDTGATLTGNMPTRRSSKETGDKRRVVVVKPDDTRIKREAEATRIKREAEAARNAVWSEAFGDYERRTGLQNATGTASRTQTTVGTLVGADHIVWNGDTGIMFGVLGGFSRTRQEFQATQNVQANTTFDVSASSLEAGAGPTNSNALAFQQYFNTQGSPGFGTSGFQYTLPDSHTIQTDQIQTLTGPSVGATLSFFKGGFFSDAVAKVDFLNLNSTTTGTDTHDTLLTANFNSPLGSSLPNGFSNSPPSAYLDVGCISQAVSKPGYKLNTPLPTPIAMALSTQSVNYTVVENVGYHFDFPRGFWIEPLVGVRYDYSTYGSNAAALGFDNGQAVRVQGGARFGLTSAVQDGYVWTNSFTSLLYSDVWINGFVIDPSSLADAAVLADEGKLRLQGILMSKIDLLNGFSCFVQAEARYGQDYWGVGGKVGFRYQW
jgi:hypothetical protein